jgi:alanine dehydrogenase
MTGGREVLVVRERDIRSLVSVSDARAAVREAFVALARGAVEQPDVLSIDLREQRGEVHAKGAYVHGSPYFSIKVAAGFYGNPERGLPVASGAVWVFDAQTGFPAAILLDNGYLTDLRTGAAGAFAAELLAPEHLDTVTIVGVGSQARFQLQALLEVRTPRRVLAWGRRGVAADLYAREMAEATGVPVTAVTTLREAVQQADAIVTTTPSREPLIDDSWVRPGTHVTAIGSDLPGKVELDPPLLARATVVADRLAQCRTQGEIAAAIAAGAIAEQDVHAELGEIAAGTKPGRGSAEEITVADLTGVGALDAAVAALVTTRARERGVGDAIST